jgi:hypothetical protein
MISGLASLELRRGLRPWLFAAAGTLVALVLLRDPPQSWFGEAPEAGAWRRRELWGTALLVFWPIALLRAAGLVGRWRTGELDWLAPRVRGLGRALIASWSGGLAAMLIGVALVGVLAEATSGPGPALRDRGWFVGTEVEAGAASDARQWTVELPRTEAGAQLAVEVLVRGYRGPAVDAGLVVRRGGHETKWQGRLGRAREVLVDLPPGEGTTELTLERRSDGAALLIERPGAQLYSPAGRLAGAWQIFARVALAAALSLALAIGFGAWVSTASAVLACAVLWIGVWLGDAPWSLPGEDLFRVLDALGRGRAAGHVTLGSLVVTALGVLAGIGLARFGLARQRRAS